MMINNDEYHFLYILYIIFNLFKTRYNTIQYNTIHTSPIQLLLFVSFKSKSIKTKNN